MRLRCVASVKSNGITKSVVILLTSFFFSAIFPSLAVSFIYFFFGLEMFKVSTIYAAYVLNLNSISNPCVYVLRNSKYRPKSRTRIAPQEQKGTKPSTRRTDAAAGTNGENYPQYSLREGVELVETTYHDDPDSSANEKISVTPTHHPADLPFPPMNSPTSFDGMRITSVTKSKTPTFVHRIEVLENTL